VPYNRRVDSTTQTRSLFRGLPAVYVIAISQLASILTSQMSQFALGVWAFERSGSVTSLGLIEVFYITPFLLMSPFAGAMVDRYNRKLMMALPDIGAAAATLFLLVMASFNALEIWHLYAAAVVSGTLGSFQWLAFSASLSLMVSKDQLVRANGLMSLTEAAPGIVAPFLAGALLPLSGLAGLLTFDLITFGVALGALLLIHIPQPPRSTEGRNAQDSMLKEAGFGFRYIFARPSLLGLQLVFFTANFLSGIGGTLLRPMVLARTGNDAAALGQVLTAGAIGLVLGGIALSAWGGPKRRVHGVLIGWVVNAVLGMLLLGLGGSVWVWAALSFVTMFCTPVINSSNQAIWQSKVAPDTQGRVFAARRLIAWIPNPITPLIAGVLADRWLEPAMQSEGALAALFGRVFGTGPGSGMALLTSAAGLLAAVLIACAYFSRAVRNAEDLLPDHNAGGY
jgi:MFS transporter, DHA3 family, macrolide efflux protein